MSKRQTATIEKALTVIRSDDGTAISRPERAVSAYAGLVAHLFGQNDQRRVVAFASTGPGEGVSSIVALLSTELSRWACVQCSIVTAADLLAAAGQRNDIVRATGGFPPLSRSVDLEIESDYLLVDGGSIAAGDILGIAARVDAVVLVVEAGRTRRRAVSQAIAAIGNAGGNVIGLVLNRRKRALPVWLEKLLG